MSNTPTCAKQPIVMYVKVGDHAAAYCAACAYLMHAHGGAGSAIWPSRNMFGLGKTVEVLGLVLAPSLN